MFLERKNCSKFSELAKKLNISIEGVKKIVKIESTGRAQNEYWAKRPRATASRDDRRIVILIPANPTITAQEITEQL